MLFCLGFSAQAQTPIFTFECFSNARMTGDSCDICVGTTFTSRSFSGLAVYRNGVFNKWIDEPYLIRLRPGNSVEFIEQAVQTPDKITIPLSQTGFSTINGFIDSTFCQGARVQYSFSVSDSLRTAAINYLDTLTFVGRGGSTVFFDTILQKVVITSPLATGGTNLSFSGTSSPVTLNSSTGTDVTLTAGAAISLSATGTNLTIINTAPDQTVTLSAGTGISVTGTYPNFTVTNTGDLSATNEGILGVGAGGANTATITTNTSGGNPITISGGGILAVTETTSTNGGTITLTANEVDGSTTNELQTLSVSGTTTATVTLSNSGGSFSITGAGTSTVGVSGSAITVTGGGGSNWTVGSGGIYNTALNNVSVGSTSVNLSRFRVSGNSANTCARFDAGTLPDFGAVTQLTGSGTTIYGTNYSLNATGNATYLNANSNAGTSANTLIQVQANGGSPLTQYQLTDGSGSAYVIGLDNAQSGNPFKIREGANFLGSTGLTMLSNGFTSINRNIPTTELDVNGTGSIDVTRGTTAERPTVTTGEHIRFNSTIGGYELGNPDNSVWYRFSSRQTPTVGWNSGIIGTGGSVTLAANSNDVCGTIIITTGTNPTGTNAAAVSITYASGYQSGVLPFVNLTQANRVTGLEWTKFYSSTSSTTLFQIGVGEQLAESTTYRINYRVQQ